MPVYFIYTWRLFKIKIQNAITETNLLINRQDHSNKQTKKQTPKKTFPSFLPFP